MYQKNIAFRSQQNVQFFLSKLTPFFRKKLHLFSGHIADM